MLTAGDMPKQLSLSQEERQVAWSSDVQSDELPYSTWW